MRLPSAHSVPGIVLGTRDIQRTKQADHFPLEPVCSRLAQLPKKLCSEHQEDLRKGCSLEGGCGGGGGLAILSCEFGVEKGSWGCQAASQLPEGAARPQSFEACQVWVRNSFHPEAVNGEC